MSKIKQRFESPRILRHKKKPNRVITKIRTGSGDGGTTFLREPGVSKASPLVDFVGTLDETCAALGFANDFGFDYNSMDENKFQCELSHAYDELVKSFFKLGAMVHSEESRLRYGHQLTQLQEKMESLMNQAVEREYVESLDGFIIPNYENGALMFARALVRKCERQAVALEYNDFVPFLNTASDFVFLVLWYIAKYYETWTGFSETTTATN